MECVHSEFCLIQDWKTELVYVCGVFIVVFFKVMLFVFFYKTEVLAFNLVFPLNARSLVSKQAANINDQFLLDPEFHWKGVRCLQF